jgi:tRNA pseudouridine55 synthase
VVPHSARELPAEGATLLVDKPRGPTSHDVIDRLRRLFGIRKIGHAGTLDPMAEGLLVVALGPATRLLQFLTGLDKDYEGEITLGAVSSTYDAEGEITETTPTPAWPTRQEVVEAMTPFQGWIEQIPPAHSAIKVDGRRLYDYARKGHEAPVKARRVRVDAFEPAQYEAPRLRFQCQVSSGTYVRSLAHDLGQALGCGGHLSALRRTVVGPFHVDKARPLEELESDPALAHESLLRPAEALPHLPRLRIDDEAAQRLANGGPFAPENILQATRDPQPDEPAAVVNAQGRLLAVCRRAEDSDEYRSLRVFPSP